MQRPPTFDSIAGVTEGLAVDGDVSQTERLSQGLDPLAEASLEGLRIEPVKDTFKRIVRGDAIGQLEEGAQPGLAVLGKANDLLPVIGSGDDSANSDGNDVDQEVTFQV